MAEFWKDKIVIVTGAARGQGAAEAKALYNLGAWVFALDVIPSDAPAWECLRTIAADDPNRMRIQRLDVSSPDSWGGLAKQIATEGIQVYGLINNAGITLRKTVTATTPEEWRHLMSINLDGAFFGIHFIAPVMQNGGAIVNVASTAGLTGYFGASYTASKWGLRGLTRTAAQELATRSIRVNCICPGLLDTPMMHYNTEQDIDKAKLFHESNRQATPLGRGARPDEIASVAVFLLSPGASFITAADVPVDGGMSGAGLYWQVGKLTGDL